MLTKFERTFVGAAIGVLSIFNAFGLGALEAQATPDRLSIGQMAQRIQLISPFSGPHGAEVRVEAHNLKPNHNYHVAMGEMQGCGYQICTPVRTNSRGDLVATVEVPDWAHTHHFEVFMILEDDLVPVAVSDPFHVTDASGRVQREGVIGVAWPACASLETANGVTYALVGDKARTLVASEGHEMLIEGRIVEGACTLQFAIEVESMELVSEGR